MHKASVCSWVLHQVRNCTWLNFILHPEISYKEQDLVARRPEWGRWQSCYGWMYWWHLWNSHRDHSTNKVQCGLNNGVLTIDRIVRWKWSDIFPVSQNTNDAEKLSQPDLKCVVVSSFASSLSRFGRLSEPWIPMAFGQSWPAKCVTRLASELSQFQTDLQMKVKWHFWKSEPD